MVSDGIDLESTLQATHIKAWAIYIERGHMEQVNSILIGTGEELIGDGLFKLAYLQALRKAYPKAHISWWAHGPSVYDGILSTVAHNYVDRLIIKATHKEVMSLGAFDLIIDTQKKFLPALRLKMMGARIFLSSALNGMLSTISLPERMPRHEIERLIALTALAGKPLVFKRDLLPLPQVYHDTAATLLPVGHKYVGFVVGAGQSRKCWPLKHFLELSSALKKRGYTPVYFVGPQEVSYAPEIQTHDPAGLFPLQDPQAVNSPLFTIALAQRLELAISNDSGGGHMMAAADIPLISLFGPTNGDKMHPLVRQGRVIKSQEFGGASMDLIPVSAVLQAVDEMMVV